MSFAAISKELLPLYHPRLALTSDGLTMIDILLLPIAQIIQPVGSIVDLRQVITNVFPKDLANNILGEINKVTTAASGDVLIEAKDAVYRYFIGEIVDISGTMSSKYNPNEKNLDSYIITQAIIDDPELFILFRNHLYQFPYGNTLNISDFMLDKIRDAKLTPGFILAIQDYLSDLRMKMLQATPNDYVGVAARFGKVTAESDFKTQMQAWRDLQGIILSYIVKESQDLLKEKRELTYLDLLKIFPK